MSEAGPRRRDFGAAALVLVVWLIPISEGALQAAPASWWPTVIRDLGSISCLFRSRPESVAYFHAQVLRAGRREWEPIDETAMFPMQPFGYRSRFDRFMERFGGKNERARVDLARWIAVRDGELDPARMPVVGVRFLAGTSAIEVDRPPTGRWHKPDARGSRVLSTHDLRATNSQEPG